MQSVARTSDLDYYTRAANDDCFYGGPRTRTKYKYDAASRLLSGLFGTGSTPQYTYSYDAASNLTSITPDATQEKFSYSTTNAIATGTYNANGSPNKFAGIAYTWDGANRLVKTVNSANNTSSSFTYDGSSRLVRVVDTVNGALTADHSYTWCGSTLCLAHDNTQSGSPVSTQYFAQGVIKSGTPYYYVRDHLGSVTELVTSTGTVAARYAYDPYGNRTVVSGTVASDIGYAGYYYHPASGFEFAMYRAYDPAHARWVNRDPEGEAGGSNLYAYVEGNPLNRTDPLGLFSLGFNVTESYAIFVPGGNDGYTHVTVTHLGCSCSRHCKVWKLDSCHGVLQADVTIQYFMNDLNTVLTRKAEMEHVDDFSTARRAIEVAATQTEDSLKSNEYPDEISCQRAAVNALTGVLGSWLQGITMFSSTLDIPGGPHGH